MAQPEAFLAVAPGMESSRVLCFFSTMEGTVLPWPSLKPLPTVAGSGRHTGVLHCWLAAWSPAENLTTYIPVLSPHPFFLGRGLPSTESSLRQLRRIQKF